MYKSKTNLYQSLDLYRANNYLKESAEVYEKLAIIYEKLGSNDNAIFHLENALKIYTNLKDEDRQNLLEKKLKKLRFKKNK